MGAFEMKDDVTQSVMVAKKKKKKGWKDGEKLPRQSLTGLGDSLDMRDKRKPGIKDGS